MPSFVLVMDTIDSREKFNEKLKDADVLHSIHEMKF